MKSSDKSKSKLEIYFFSFAFIFSIVFLFWLLRPFYSDFLLSFVLVGIFTPFYNWLLKHTQGRKKLASALVCFVILVVCLGPLAFLVSTITAQAASVYQSSLRSFDFQIIDRTLFGDNAFARNMELIANTFNYEYTAENVQQAVLEIVKFIGKFLYDQLNNLFSNVIGFLFHFSIMILIIFFLFIDGDKLQKFLFDLSPLPDVEDELIRNRFIEVSKAILVGNGISSTIQGLLGGLAFYFAGIPSAIFWGSVMSILAFLPIIGITFVYIPTCIILLVWKKYLTALLLFLFCTALSLITENFIKPTLIGSKVEMHTLLVFLSILGGLAAFGILGILYGPFIVTLFFTFQTLYTNSYKRIISDSITPRSLQKCREETE